MKLLVAFLKLLSRLFDKKKEVDFTEEELNVIEEAKPVKTPKKEPRIYVTFHMWASSSNRYPERLSAVTPEIEENARDLIERVNALLNELEWEPDVFISSGLRTPKSNAKVANAATRSSHMTGKALDIMQLKPGNKLGEAIRAAQASGNLLERHGLMMEALEHTVGQNTNWVHLDTVKRAYRKSGEFNP
jgi:hypothetical protein